MSDIAAAREDKHFMESIQQAEDAFWAVIVERYPDAESGDFPPGAAYNVEQALIAAAIEWLYWNLSVSAYADVPPFIKAIRDRESVGQ